MSQKWFLILFLFLCPLKTPAHEGHHHGHHHDHEHNDDMNLIESLYEKTARLSPEILSPRDSLAHPYIKINGERVYLNSAFFELLLGFLRLYFREMEKEGCSCNLGPEEMVETVRNEIAKGGIVSKKIKKSTHLMERLWVKKVKYGRTVLIGLAVVETIETFILAPLLPGLHVFCKANNAAVLFFARPIQSYVRTFIYSKIMEQSRIRMMVSRISQSHLMRKFQQKVRFYLEAIENAKRAQQAESDERFRSYMESIEIDETQLQAVNEEGPGDKREEWVREISKKRTPLLEEIDRIEEELRNSDKTLSKRKRSKLLKRQQNLMDEVDSLTQLSRKTYLGKRYKRWLFLKGRKGSPGYLSGNTYLDEITSSDWLWIGAAKENILERSFVSLFPEQSDEREQTFSPMESNDIRRGLAEEFVEKVSRHHSIGAREEYIEAVEFILNGVEKIFDPSLPTRERYLWASLAEPFLSEFMEPYLWNIYRELKGSDRDFERFTYWNKLIEKLFRFSYLTNEYSDFLTSAALIKDEKSLIFYKYRAMGSLLRFFEYLIELPEIVKTSHGREEILSRLDENLQKIESSRMGREKRTASRRLGIFGRKTPLCEAMVRKTQ